MSAWGRIIGAASVTTGVIGAAALGGVTAQRRAVRRYRTLVASDSPGYDTLAADRTYSVLAEDGVVLHVEEVGPENAPLTVIFGHGWTLRSGSWHYQRLGLAGPGFGADFAGLHGDVGAGFGPAEDPGRQARLVFFDQRSHGKSSRADVDHVSMLDLAGDLAAVMATAAPSGPVVLVGHSMGGMALITLAGSRPTLFSGRIAGVALISTAASQSSTKALVRNVVSLSAPLFKVAGRAAGRYPDWIERARAGSHDAVWLLTRALGFARPDVPGELVDYLDEMISATPLDVITDFAPALMAHDQAAALPVLAALPVVIICGDADRQTPLPRSLAMGQALPDAEVVVIQGAGHLAILESPDIVNAALRQLLHRAIAHSRPISESSR